MDRRDGEPARLKALVEGRDWAPLGTTGAEIASQRPEIDARRSPKSHDLQDINAEPERGLEPLTFRLQGECSTS
jgi:hypothetical protein